jgi:hypothetical protein
MINEHELELVNEMSISIYRRGYEDGVVKTEKINDKAHDDGYNKGLNDVWEYIKKLGKLTIGELYEIFGDEYDNIYAITDDYDASEFIDVIKRYEEKQKCKECKWDEFRDAQRPVGTPCDSCFEGKNFSQKAPSIARFCSKLNDVCPYIIECEECEVHCSIERAKKKLKGDKE